MPSLTCVALGLGSAHSRWRVSRAGMSVGRVPDHHHVYTHRLTDPPLDPGGAVRRLNARVYASDLTAGILHSRAGRPLVFGLGVGGAGRVAVVQHRAAQGNEVHRYTVRRSAMG